MCDIDGILAQRGILDVAVAAGWQQETITKKGEQFTGWSFPVYNAGESPHDGKRWKNSNGNGPRYYWTKGQPKQAKYYFLPGLNTAIQAQNGTLFLASGEPDVLAYHAAGNSNTLCWFNGEESIPKTFVTDMMYLGVVHIIYAPDRDDTGMRAAAKLVETLRDSPITYHVAQLPGELGSKADVNQAWIDSKFDPNTFWGFIWQDELDLTRLAMYAGMPGKSAEDTGREVEKKVKEWRNDWSKLLRDSMGPPDAVSNKVARWHCPLPGHEDKNPSFRWSDDKTPGFFWPMCSCGIQNHPDPLDEIAVARGLEVWAEYYARRALEAGYVRGTSTRPQRDPTTGKVEAPRPQFVNMRSEYAALAAELSGETQPAGSPIRFPYQVLRRFDGFADFMWTGKAVAVGGISGGGKTLLLRVLAAAMMNAGYDVAWWGPEWSPNEYAIQDLQRMGGLNFKQINHYRAIRAMMRDNDWTVDRALTESGLTMPTDGERQQSVQILKRLGQKPGQMFIIPDTEIPVADAMSKVKAWAQARRADGAQPAALFWDYLQLSNAPGGQDWKWGNKTAGAIKAGCSWSAANLVAFISTQSRKGDAERVREDGEKLKIGSFQGLDDHLFNLALTITPGYVDGAKQPWAALSVEKNSMGKTGMVAVDARWDRLLILDKENTSINLRSYFAGKKNEDAETFTFAGYGDTETNTRSQ